MTFAYIATPYTKYPAGIEAAFQDAARAVAGLLRKGFAAYSPIAHTHPVAIYGDIDPLDHSIWLSLDEHMMRAADECFVIHMEGWDTSYGVAHEIKFFQDAGKPVRHVSWPDLEEIDNG